MLDMFSENRSEFGLFFCKTIRTRVCHRAFYTTRGSRPGDGCTRHKNAREHIRAAISAADSYSSFSTSPHPEGMCHRVFYTHLHLRRANRSESDLFSGNRSGSGVVAGLSPLHLRRADLGGGGGGVLGGKRAAIRPLGEA